MEQLARTGGKVSNKYPHMWRLEGGGGGGGGGGGAPEPFSCPRTPKKETHILLLEGFFFFPQPEQLHVSLFL